MLYDNLSVNESGHLTIAGFDACELAEMYGTPLYVLDEDHVREKCRTYVNAMRASFPEGSMPLYAGKALCFKGIYPIVQSEGMDAATMREFVTDIGAEAERLQRTTEKLLNLSRRDDGVQGELQDVDLKAAVDGTHRLLEPLAQASRVTVETDLAEGCVVRATEDDIYHIVFNLVENAIKYNLPMGKVLVTVRREGDRCRLVVEDTGIGIPEADRPNVFTRFYRVDKARSREHGGSGLGLSIVHDAVKLYGGEITLEGVEPHGTRFIVDFPAAEES